MSRRRRFVPAFNGCSFGSGKERRSLLSIAREMNRNNCGSISAILEALGSLDTDQVSALIGTPCSAAEVARQKKELADQFGT